MFLEGRTGQGQGPASALGAVPGADRGPRRPQPAPPSPRANLRPDLALGDFPDPLSPPTPAGDAPLTHPTLIHPHALLPGTKLHGADTEGDPCPCLEEPVTGVVRGTQQACRQMSCKEEGSELPAGTKEVSYPGAGPWSSFHSKISPSTCVLGWFHPRRPCKGRQLALLIVTCVFEQIEVQHTLSGPRAVSTRAEWVNLSGVLKRRRILGLSFLVRRAETHRTCVGCSGGL